VQSFPRAAEPGDAKVFLEQLRASIRESFVQFWDDFMVLETRIFLQNQKAHIEHRFETFRRSEVQLSGWNPAHLALHLKLNYPTFRMQHLEYEESADDTNNSTKSLLNKSLRPSETFWFEACSPRQSPTSSRHQEVVTKLWPEHAKIARADFSHSCEAYEKKSLILFGAPNRKGFNQRHKVEGMVIKASKKRARHHQHRPRIV